MVSGRRPLPFDRLVRMRRARLVRILAGLARSFGRFERVGVVPLLGCTLPVGLLLLDLDATSTLFGGQRCRLSRTTN
jgi:hypothetical protein